MYLGAGMDVSFCRNGQTSCCKFIWHNLSHTRHTCDGPQWRPLLWAVFRMKHFSTVQNQPRQIHQWLGLSQLAVPRSRCGVRLPLALLCVWGPQESLTLCLWGRAYIKVVQVLSQTHGWGPDSVIGSPCAVVWLLDTCTLPLWISFLVFSLIKALKAHISLPEYWEPVWSHSLTAPAFIC